ncbi:MAG: hypothetical protein A3F84_23460 [Candidatus Handelsmanbacteria bacterium RIFCSPLOWO2_12_FULL_64_10]|uniref:Glycerol-3-phosphate dehydrogenase n=1 Tax=Handelsmanbacteria sp. (strain RIFCSPLOWO2_12_FULL_64_10) TaxID=1817868 RepID=A0A1F6CRJ7_HANXR|nr:MAG: hypothetical protein A3F84_23460 [Candidatus Handelsmanbacteria bacterium RIFCSPLOWO2_12_FULL_64_10]
MSEEGFDILVIGGGITGAGIAREATYRGFRVALVEKDDFASGASGRSTRLIHGGLRYLEQMQLRLVFEASRERRILLRIAPHLVRPLPILLPITRRSPHSYTKVAAGMWMYDLLALFRNVERHRMLRPADVARMEPILGGSDLDGAAYFYDATADDSRLTLATVLSAHEAGAVVANHAEAVGLIREGSRVAGGVVRDGIDGSERVVRARLVVNACGPWADQIQDSGGGGKGQRRLRLSKGVHVNVPRARLPLRQAVAMTSPTDGRLMFAVPDGAFAYAGTTDTPYEEDPDRVAADASDVAYILEALNASFPGCRITEEDVISAWAGLRPLIDRDARNTYETSREHAIWESAPGLLTIAGGKLTTYRAMACDLLRAAEPHIRAAGARPKGVRDTARTLLPETPEGAAGSSSEGSSLGPFPAWEGVDRAVGGEMALTLCDVLIRRTRIFYEAPDQGVSLAAEVASRIGLALNWDEAERRRQVALYEAEVALSRAWRKG